ncbi:helix-turn-helix transcriptional regulator [Glaciibacter psychrotolerans]|uniref:Putative DNA-binding transcriptional regulator AlpA n=1 Tax=Glaciibacter psychrotolerans TaxID=670054 RepID=A0A7Z0EDB2_9MICO|nr:putative DNA-binding transcriptional regulator AlpA [Leifsonia psychrotolerans]
MTRNGPITPVRGGRGVLLPGWIRTRPDPAGLLTASVVHLVGMDPTTQIAPTFLTQRELAELLQLPERTLEDWRLAHTGPPYLKLGRHVRYDLHDVLAWVQEQRHG